MNTFKMTQGEKRLVFHLFLPMILFFTGCPHDEYTLKLSMQGDVLHRELTIENNGKTYTKEELAALETIYHQKIEQGESKTYTFSGQFTGKTPNDIGGNGSALHYGCSLGSVWVYIETFRGNDNIAGEIETRIQATNRIIDFLRGWLKYEFGTMDEFKKFDDFFDTTVRQDAKCLALYWWRYINSRNTIHIPYRNRLEFVFLPPHEMSPSSQPTSQPTSMPTSCPGEEDDEEMTRLELTRETERARVIQFLYRRNYIPEKLMSVLAEKGPLGIPEIISSDPKILLQHFLYTKVGLSKHSPLLNAIQTRFKDYESLHASIMAFCKTTPEYASIKKEVETEAASQPADEAPPQSSLEDRMSNRYTEKLIMPHIQDCGVFAVTADEFKSTLQLPVNSQIVVHNGLFDKENHTIQWAGSLPPRTEEYHNLPGVCCATWTVPNETEQKRRFGKVALNGNDHANYIVWLNALTPEKIKQWNTFLDTITPQNAAEAILTFRFDGSAIPDIHDYDSGLRSLYRKVSGKEPPELATQPATTEEKNNE